MMAMLLAVSGQGRDAPKAKARAAAEAVLGHNAGGGEAKFRAIPGDTAQATYQAHQAMYDDIARRTNSRGRGSNRMARDFIPGAAGGSVILMAACQDNQVAADGADNGLFTQNLKDVWNDGGFEGNYAMFVSTIAERMPHTQTPNYFPFGHEDHEFESEQPFSLGASPPDGEGPSPARPPSGQPSQGGAPGPDNQRLLIEAYLRLLDAVGAPPLPNQLRPPSAASRAVGATHLAYVHGISVHLQGYSDAWWQALHQYTDLFGAGELAADAQDLGRTRHEVIWSDLVNPREAVRGQQADAEALRQRIRDVLDDRHSRQAAQAGRQLRARAPGWQQEVPPRAVARERGLPDPIDAFLSLGYQDFIIYMVNDGMRQRIIDRFTGVLRPLLASGANVDVISHSWGTVVAYEGLRELESSDSLSGRVANFFTAGSALSIPPVRSRLREQNKDGRRPAQVDRWINLDAEGDLVGGTLLDMFAVDVENLNLQPTGCQRTLWGHGWYELGCAHGSYFQAQNQAVNRDIFARFINS
jgi:hypothetical protein